MDLSNLKWIKNVRDQNSETTWAYFKIDKMSIPEAKIFRLHWHKKADRDNAQLPQKGEQIALIQKAKVTHIVELLDSEVYESEQNDWSIYRVVKAIWMPPKELEWEKLPHQSEVFGLNYLTGNGQVHNLASTDKMFLFHSYWDPKGGLTAFQDSLKHILTGLT